MSNLFFIKAPAFNGVITVVIMKLTNTNKNNSFTAPIKFTGIFNTYSSFVIKNKTTTKI